MDTEETSLSISFHNILYTMKIPLFIREYMALVNNIAAKKELSELGEEYYRTLHTRNEPANGKIIEEAKGQQRRRTQYAFIVKARMIAKSCVDDKARFEAVCWKHAMKFNIVRSKKLH